MADTSHAASTETTNAGASASTNTPPKPKRPAAKGGFRMLTDEVLDGFDIDDIKCRSCSGYGNCGFKSTFLKEEGGIESICMQMRHRLKCKRDGIPFDPKDIGK